MGDEFPTPRRSSAMFIYQRQLMLWGGLTQVFIGEGEEQFMYDTDIPGKVLYLYAVYVAHLIFTVYGIEIS